MSNKQRLVLSIIDFLNQSIGDGTVKQDDKESLEVAIQCIGEAFGVDPSDQVQCERLTLASPTATTASAAPSASASKSANSPSPDVPSAADKAAAEKLKSDGNAQMSGKKYDEAISSYTRAIALDSTNAVYYSNRAAAYSSKGDHPSAVLDAEKAIEVDPSFVKAYHRLGHAHYSLADFKAAAAAFRRGLELDPSNASLKSGLQNAETRIVTDDE
ncbi:Small glutamine-rich tetratricopeptide repeat-containing protein alpha [Grifola frondosa]|uniref:Small glutamine-rich tetratricopeptide repeat-containing protein alpha n=1 Tax=Grifola frondosa TaxID=5627 RepID=A0A1C7MT53_GRIFR|nr:Small glutamine-rich tetratricopeptide repeat-containing protein alpha [Grifola frondosa]